MSRAHPRFKRPNAPLPAAIPNLFEVVLFGTIEGQVTINTFYYADGGAALNSTSESDCANAFVTAVVPDLCAAISSDWTSTNIKCACLTSPTRSPFVSNLTSPGLAAAGHEPTTVCITVRRWSLVRGQAGRGRISLPAVPSSFVTGSQLNVPGQTAAHTAATGVGLGFVSGAKTYSPQIVSRKNVAGPLLGASPLIGANYDMTLGSCRRRKLGRGI